MSFQVFQMSENLVRSVIAYIITTSCKYTIIHVRQSGNTVHANLALCQMPADFANYFTIRLSSNLQEAAVEVPSPRLNW